MLRCPTLPATWRGLLEALRPAFRRGRRSRCSCCWPAGWWRRPPAGPWSGCWRRPGWRRSCRSTRAADSSRRIAGTPIGSGSLAWLIVSRLLAERAAIEVVIDDTLFRRWGRKVHAVFWTHDGAAQDPNALGRGNRWVVLSIVVELPFCCHPVSLPVLLRFWARQGHRVPSATGRRTDLLLAKEFPDRLVHAVGDAAYHGKALLVPATTITTRLPANAALYALAPPRTGKRGRPRSKGARLGRPVDLAATAQWRRAAITRYGAA